MKKVLVVFLMLVLSIGFITSCEPESIADTDNIYAGDKDEEPDH